MRPDFPACFRCRSFISTQHGEKQLLGTRNKGEEPVASVIHSDGHSLAWLDAPILQHSRAPVRVPLTTAELWVHPATGFSGGFSCEILIGTEAGFGRELYSPSLHRTESSGTAPNPTSKHNSSHPSHHIFDYPGNNQPLI